MWYYRKKKKKEGPVKRVKLEDKDKSELVMVLDRYFALYIRLRDTMPNGMCWCISCGKIKPFEKMDCGHYVSRANFSLRYSELNCNAECSQCNRMSSDHLIGYRDNLIRKIGQAKYDYLIAESKTIKHYERFELLAMIKYYKKEVERLSKEKGIKVSV